MGVSPRQSSRNPAMIATGEFSLPHWIFSPRLFLQVKTYWIPPEFERKTSGLVSMLDSPLPNLAMNTCSVLVEGLSPLSQLSIRYRWSESGLSKSKSKFDGHESIVPPPENKRTSRTPTWRSLQDPMIQFRHILKLPQCPRVITFFFIFFILLWSNSFWPPKNHPRQNLHATAAQAAWDSTRIKRSSGSAEPTTSMDMISGHAWRKLPCQGRVRREKGARKKHRSIFEPCLC